MGALWYSTCVFFSPFLRSSRYVVVFFGELMVNWNAHSASMYRMTLARMLTQFYPKTKQESASECMYHKVKCLIKIRVRERETARRWNEIYSKIITIKLVSYWLDFWWLEIKVKHRKLFVSLSESIPISTCAVHGGPRSRSPASKEDIILRESPGSLPYWFLWRNTFLSSFNFFSSTASFMTLAGAW